MAVTKKDLITIANSMADVQLIVNPDEYAKIIAYLAYSLQQTNPSFKLSIFMKACNVPLDRQPTTIAIYRLIGGVQWSGNTHNYYNNLISGENIISNIPLHKTRGLDPHLTYCPRCGGDGTGLTLGALRKATLEDGRVVYAQLGKTARTAKDLGLQPFELNWVDVDEHERVPDSSICDECEQEVALHKKEVDLGGVYFRCLACSTTGVIKHNHALAVSVRKDAGVKAPEPIGVEFDKCEQHGGKPDE